MKQLILSNGSSRFGAQMGRCNELPADVNAPIKLQMVKLKWVDGDFDEFGAYWGNSGDNIYCAFTDNVKIFVRAKSRLGAKSMVRNLVPNARFYN